MDLLTSSVHDQPWAGVYAHRERLLRIARARLGNVHDAEDCVQEAMLRAVEFEHLDEERLGQFLTAVTTRLCADVHRRQARGDRLSRRLTAYAESDPGHEDMVCDRAESVWLSHRVGELPDRQRAIVEARAEGLSCGAVAERFLLSYTAVESAIARARRSVRIALESTLGVTACPPAWRRVRQFAAPAIVAGVTAVGILTPSTLHRHPALPDDPARSVAAPSPRLVNTAHVVATAARAAHQASPALARAGRTIAPTIPDPPPETDIRLEGPHDTAVGARIDRHHYTFQERLQHCLTYGPEISPGPRVACGYPPDDSHSLVTGSLS